MFKKGDRVILKLDTVIGQHGISMYYHNNICVIISGGGPWYLIRDGKYQWIVHICMLAPAIKLGEQMKFDFMKD